MSKTAQELFADMAKAAGWTTEQVTLALATDAGKELNNGYVRHAEYSSALDKARNLEGEAAKAKQWEGWWKENSPRIQNLQTEHATLKERLKQAGYTDLQAETTATAQTGAGAGLTMEQVQQLFTQRDNNYSSLLRDTMSILSEHDSARLGRLDVPALEKIAQEKQLTLKGAYDQFIAPKVKELETKDLEARITREREEAVKDYASRNNLPVNIDRGLQPGANFGPRTGEAAKAVDDAGLMSMWADAGK